LGRRPLLAGIGGTAAVIELDRLTRRYGAARGIDDVPLLSP
jgi:hypothetical protein